jgi:hypothetical protein
LDGDKIPNVHQDFGYRINLDGDKIPNVHQDFRYRLIQARHVANRQNAK